MDLSLLCVTVRRGKKKTTHKSLTLSVLAWTRLTPKGQPYFSNFLIQNEYVPTGSAALCHNLSTPISIAVISLIF